MNIKLAFILMLFATCVGKAEDVILLVQNSDSSKNEKDTDEIYKELRIKNFESLISGLPVRTILVDPSDLTSDLLTQTKQQLKSGDNLRGLVLFGHGNPRTFSYNKYERYSGNQLSAAISDLLHQMPVSSKFTVYLQACSTACEAVSEQNLITALSRGLSEKLQDTDGLQEIEVIGHVTFSDADSTRPATFLERAVIKTKAPEILSFALWKLFPYSSVAPKIAPVLPLALGYATLFLGHHGYIVIPAFEFAAFSSIFMAFANHSTHKIILSITTRFDGPSNDQEAKRDIARDRIRRSMSGCKQLLQIEN